ncbi:hypothetical protein OSB04_026748 [Centaurea solstitialis]|uniref:Uncharacterized protein n=1 Tax=Centaurea solstitialis TaxID=347529 RepID=A0AA38VZ12_9ASTR|nr:hypothetical protein OSB04_026748 [Centaurea solstitialis]
MATRQRASKTSDLRTLNANDQKVSEAISAMKCLGVSPEVVKPVLNRLLKLYGSWDFIEEDNYRALADNIFQYAEDKESRSKQKSEAARVHDEQDPPPKGSHSGKSKDQVPDTKENGNVTVPEASEPQRTSAPKRLIKSSVSGQRNQKMEADTIQTKHKCNAEGSHSRKSENHAPSTKENGNMTGSESAPKRLIESSVFGQSNQKMEADTIQTEHKCKGEGSMSSNKKSVDARLASQRASSSSECEPAATGGTHVTLTQRKKRQIRESDEDTDPIAKLIRPAVQHGHPNPPVPTTVQQQHNAMPKKSLHNIKDITRGTEKMKISLIDEVGIQLPKFVYIPQNTPYQDAYVHFSLARIADDGCCSRCIGDCLSSRVPCACSRETGGEFAYTPQGLLKDEFLEACISMNLEPQNHHLFQCQDCPLERAKNVQNPEPCKGHLLRKFIKECWRKCGCTMECGNRVVQRGPTCKLQVFSTEGKGWGLRTLEYLPKGSFVCEYVGEILTNMELYERNKKGRKNERHTYPVYLDADWGSEQVLKDEDALCLDATNFGNVGRCFDSNLIEIPVEVETPDHHYYHIAFFTNRNVEAYEELTWDYGIDFEDDGHPIKAFRCQCESSYCRDVRREVAGSKEQELKLKRAASGNF